MPELNKPSARLVAAPAMSAWTMDRDPSAPAS